MESQKRLLEVRPTVYLGSMRRWRLHWRVALVSSLWLILTALGSLELKAAESDSEDYNFSWLDPDKKIYVLQNRKYKKALRPLLSLMGGVGMSNPYKSAKNIDGRFAFYISEIFGIEAFYTGSSYTSNNTLKALEISSRNALPSIRQVDSEVGGMIHFVPWYAKINVFNQILYFDWYFGLGLSTVSTNVNTRTSVSSPDVYEKQSFTAGIFSTGHQYYLSDHFIARIDLTGAFYQAPISGTTGESGWFSNYNFALGIGWRM